MRRCCALAASSALMTAAWRCRKTNMVRSPPTLLPNCWCWTFTADVSLVKYLIFHFVRFSEKPHHEEGVKRKRGPAKSVCPYNKASKLQQMRDEILGTVQDIEQLLKLGRETHSCPYYSTRLAIPPAQVILSSSVSPFLCRSALEVAVLCCVTLIFFPTFCSLT